MQKSFVIFHILLCTTLARFNASSTFKEDQATVHDETGELEREVKVRSTMPSSGSETQQGDTIGQEIQDRSLIPIIEQDVMASDPIDERIQSQTVPTDVHEAIAASRAEEEARVKSKVATYERNKPTLKRVVTKNVAAAARKSKAKKTAVKRNQLAQDAMQYLDGLAAGTSTATSFGDCAVTKTDTGSDCSVNYSPTGQCAFVSVFRAMFKDLPDEKFAELSASGVTRNLILAHDTFQLRPESVIEINTCGRRKKLGVKDIRADTVSPLSWMTLNSVTMSKAFVFYEDMAAEGNTYDWIKIGLEGSATTEIAGLEATVNILKEWKGEEVGDSDVLLSINTTDNEIPIVTFLSWLQQDASSLYPSATGISTSSLQIEQTSIEKRDGALIKIILGNYRLWDAYVTGEAIGSAVLDAANKVFVYCKNGDLEQFSRVSCAILAKYSNEKFRWDWMTSGFSLRDLSSSRPIVEAMIESGDLFFQTSRDSFQFIDDLFISNEFSAFTSINENGKNVMTDNFVTAGMCIRFRMDNFKTAFPDLISKKPIDGFAAHLCPFQNEVRMHLPESFPNAVFKYGGLTTLVLNDNADPGFGIRDNEYFKIVEITIKSTDFCMSILPNSSYQMLEHKGAVQLNHTIFKQCFDGHTWTISGSGNETIVNASSHVDIIQKEIRFGITGTLNIFDAKIIQERAGVSYLSKRYQGAFNKLMSFPLNDLRFESFFTKRREFFLKGDAQIHGKKNIRSEFIYYFNENSNKMELALCMKLTRASVDGMISYMYNSSSLGSHPWITYANVGAVARKSRADAPFDRPFCNNIESTYDDDMYPENHDKGWNGGIVLYGENIEFSNCMMGGTVDVICRFYQRVFDGTSLDVKYYGQAKPDKRYFLEGRFNTPIKLGPGIEIRGKLVTQNQATMGKIVHKITTKIARNTETEEDEITGSNKMEGTLWFEEIEANFPAMLKFTGESILFNVPKLETSELGTNILGVANVRSENVRSEWYPLKLDGPIDAIEFHSRLLIGSSQENLISIIGGRNNTAQYIHGRGSSKNKFYACKKSDDNVKLNKVFAAFGVRYRHNIMSSAMIEDACFTYHDGSDGDSWKVPNRNFNAEPGLRLYGKLNASFGANLPMEVSFEDNSIKMFSLLPPMTWGVSKVEVDQKTFEGTIRKVTKNLTRIRMTFNESEGQIGPKLFIHYQNGALIEGYLEGYIRTVGFSGMGNISISANTAGKIANYEFVHNGLLYDVIEGHLRLSASYTEKTITEIDFTLDLDVLTEVKEDMPDVVQKCVTTFAESYDRVHNALESDIRRVTNLLTEHSAIHNSIVNNFNSLNTAVKKSKIERTRALQAASKRCAKECKPVHMPGLKWEKKCTNTRIQQDSRYLKFSKHAHTVSDVGCVAQCESERIRSHVEAVHHDNVARSNIAKLADAAVAKELSQNLVEKINDVKSKLTALKANLMTPSKFMRDLKSTNAANLIAVSLIKSNYPIIEAASEPQCLKFRFNYEISTDDDETSKQMELEESICFGESFVDDLVDLALRKAYKTENENLQGVLDEIDEEKTVALKGFYKAVENDAAIIQKQMQNSARSDAAKKSFLPTANLSPLRSSLFHVSRDRTVMMFDTFSPWVVLKKNDPFKEVRPALTKSKIEETRTKNACVETRQTVQDYQDIIGYMKAWSSAVQYGQKSMKTVNAMVKKRVTAAKSYIERMATSENVLVGHADKMRHWMNVTENGMRKWMKLSTQRLQQLDKEGVKLMKDELSYMYSENEYKSIDDFLKKSAKKGNRVFKKAIIPGKDDEPFSKLSQELLHILKENNKLQSLLPVIEKIESKAALVDKRSISCNMK